jgi:hypothetical protein
MILSASKISGYNYTASPTLGTIAEPICWFDWRFGREDRVYSGVTRVFTINDLSPNNFLLEGSTTNANTSRPMLLSDGIGMDINISTTRGASLQRQITDSKYEILHKGNPFLIMNVVKPVTLDNFIFLLSTNGATTAVPPAGLRFRIDSVNSRVDLLIRNDAGTAIVNVNTGTGSISTGGFTFIAAQYYGSGSGSNNLKIWINNNQYTFTANPTFGTGVCAILRAFSSAGPPGNTSDFSTKLGIAYDLTGKTASEIDDFRTLAITTLKRDPEYSSLTTP